MKWDKGNTPIMPQIVPGTTIRIRAPWQKNTQPRVSATTRPGGPALRLVEPAREVNGEVKAPQRKR